MNNSLYRYIIFVSMLIVVLAFSSCSYNPGNTQANATATPWIIVITYTPTEDLGVIETSVVETFSMQLTETELAMPTETPVPPSETPTSTFTPSVTNTPTPTNTVVTMTETPAKTKTSTSTPTDSKWACSITFQLIEKNQVFNPYEDFDGRWTIKNTGTEIWQTNDVDYRYMSGTEMQKYNKVYDLPSEVDPGESITITVDMKAPGSSGYYETFWALARHSDGFCSLPTRIKVK